MSMDARSKNIVHVAHVLRVSDKRPLQANDILQGLLPLKSSEEVLSQSSR